MAFKIYKVSFVCPVCGHVTPAYDRISDRPERCPHCGACSARSLSESEREEFSEEFYSRDEAPDDAVDGNPCPYGCPWLFGWEVELRGATIEEMVDNYIEDYKSEFSTEEDDLEPEK
jgi:hypothetical protein